MSQRLLPPTTHVITHKFATARVYATRTDPIKDNDGLNIMVRLRLFDVPTNSVSLHMAREIFTYLLTYILMWFTITGRCDVFTWYSRYRILQSNWAQYISCWQVMACVEWWLSRTHDFYRHCWRRWAYMHSCSRLNCVRRLLLEDIAMAVKPVKRKYIARFAGKAHHVVNGRWYRETFMEHPREI